MTPERRKEIERGFRASEVIKECLEEIDQWQAHAQSVAALKDELRDYKGIKEENRMLTQELGRKNTLRDRENRKALELLKWWREFSEKHKDLKAYVRLHPHGLWKACDTPAPYFSTCVFLDGDEFSRGGKIMTENQQNHLRLLGIARYEDTHGDKETAKIIEWAFDEIERLQTVASELGLAETHGEKT